MFLTSRDEYVCMKSMVCDYGSFERELRAYRALSSAAQAMGWSNEGRHYVRELLDDIELCHSERNYCFFIHEPLGNSAQLLLDAQKGNRFHCDYAKNLAVKMLKALDFIHKAGVVHAGLLDQTPTVSQA